METFSVASKVSKPVTTWTVEFIGCNVLVCLFVSVSVSVPSQVKEKDKLFNLGPQ